ncbi:ATP-binding protein [Streptomyces collinus]|uniref:ATP-binding protein n=1 Tax=Streptomyces collinus TaxID=42684 RepID=UPI0036AA220F
MPVPALPVRHRSASAVSAVTVAAVTAVVLAPAVARVWTLAVVVSAWSCVVATGLAHHRVVGGLRLTVAAREAETGRLTAQVTRTSSETGHLVDVTLPALTERLRDGVAAADALTGVPTLTDPQLSRLVRFCAATVEEDVRHVTALDGERRQSRDELVRLLTELERFTQETLPTVVSRLGSGHSVATLLAELDPAYSLQVRTLAESFVREFAHSERRTAAAQAASAKVLGRVQALAVAMLADLRAMQERHGEEVFGDLLKLDHSTARLGLMADRLALLMGGRSSRSWNRPIVMESILRGAVGRIAAHHRVRLHCTSTAAISGYAAEGVMHLLAELTDNAANFSPPIDEVHVYVEEHSAGIAVTIEDSGLKMADAAMRRAKEAVAGRMSDLASLQGTRLGLAVVGCLAVKYAISVHYRPSSRGGTSVVVLLPPHLRTQRRDAAPRETSRRPATQGTPPRSGPQPLATGEQTPGRSPLKATPNGLPTRTPGRSMAEAALERERRRAASSETQQVPPEQRTARDPGSRFESFHRASRSASDATGDSSRPATEPPEPA